MGDLKLLFSYSSVIIELATVRNSDHVILPIVSDASGGAGGGEWLKRL